MKRAIRTLKKRESDPTRTTAYQTEIQPWSYTNRKQGRPRNNWADGVNKDFWNL